MTMAIAAMNAAAKSVMMAGNLRAISRPVMSGTMSNHAEMLNVCCRLFSMVIVSVRVAVEPLRPTMVKTTSAMMSDGVVVSIMYFMWVKSGTSAVDEASTVVSLIIDILSPK